MPLMPPRKTGRRELDHWPLTYWDLPPIQLQSSRMPTGARRMSSALDRRSFMTYFAGVGLTSTLFPGVLWAKIAAGADITVDTIASAEEVAGVHFDQSERELMLDGLKQQEQRIEALHKVSLPNSV